MLIRHLPSKNDILLDTSKFPKNIVLYNPSASEQYIAIRVTKHENRVQTNNVALYNKKSNSMTFIDSPLHLLHPTCNLYRGLEDVRIICHKGLIWFTATTTHATERMTNELVFGRFNAAAKDIEKVWVVDVGILPVKNVVPFVHNNEFFLLDVLQQKIFRLEYDEESDIYSAVVYHNIRSMGDKELKASTSPVYLHGNIWGCVVHTDVKNEELTHMNRLSYLHYWMEFDFERGAVTFISTPFWCVSWSFEYISGIEYDPKDGLMILYGGVQDSAPVSIATRLSKLRNSK